MNKMKNFKRRFSLSVPRTETIEESLTEFTEQFNQLNNQRNEGEEPLGTGSWARLFPGSIPAIPRLLPPALPQPGPFAVPGSARALSALAPWPPWGLSRAVASWHRRCPAGMARPCQPSCSEDARALQKSQPRGKVWGWAGRDPKVDPIAPPATVPELLRLL
uniref:CDK18 n=1 Tax=Malurus cyaneus samueli TaxID=2593467 RepID=A0A8C5TNR1_9PASS